MLRPYAIVLLLAASVSAHAEGLASSVAAASAVHGPASMPVQGASAGRMPVPQGQPLKLTNPPRQIGTSEPAQVITRSRDPGNRGGNHDELAAGSDAESLFWTKWTAIYTGALAAIGLGQFCMFIWQLAMMRSTARDAREAADAARISANIARDSFINLERPWVLVNGWRVRRREGPPIQPDLLNNFFIAVRFKNFGRTPAFIKSLRVAFINKAELPGAPDFSQCTALLDCPASVTVDGEIETREIGPQPGQDIQYVFVGYLVYEDFTGAEHHTGFAVDVSPNIPAASANPNRLYDFRD